MALPNRETGEPAPARNQDRSARERLQDINSQSRVELENSLLKENLTEYTVLFEKLKIEQNDFLQKAERSWQQERQRNEQQMQSLREHMNVLKDANEQLNANMSEAIAALTSDVRAATVQTVDEGLKANKAALDSAAKKVTDYEKGITKTMSGHLATFNSQQNKLFKFDSFRSLVFWAGCISNIFSLILLLWVLFGKG